MKHEFSSEWHRFLHPAEDAGVLIVSQKTATVVTIEELLLIWTASEDEEWVNRIAVIPL